MDSQKSEKKQPYKTIKIVAEKKKKTILPRSFWKQLITSLSIFRSHTVFLKNRISTIGHIWAIAARRERDRGFGTIRDRGTKMGCFREGRPVKMQRDGGSH